MTESLEVVGQFVLFTTAKDGLPGVDLLVVCCLCCNFHMAESGLENRLLTKSSENMEVVFPQPPIRSAGS